MSNTPENQLNTSATDSTTAKKSSGLGFKLALTLLVLLAGTGAAGYLAYERGMANPYLPEVLQKKTPETVTLTPVSPTEPTAPTAPATPGTSNESASATAPSGAVTGNEQPANATGSSAAATTTPPADGNATPPAANPNAADNAATAAPNAAPNANTAANAAAPTATAPAPAAAKPLISNAVTSALLTTMDAQNQWQALQYDFHQNWDTANALQQIQMLKNQLQAANNSALLPSISALTQVEGQIQAWNSLNPKANLAALQQSMSDIGQLHIRTTQEQQKAEEQAAPSGWWNRFIATLKQVFEVKRVNTNEVQALDNATAAIVKQGINANLTTALWSARSGQWSVAQEQIRMASSTIAQYGQGYNLDALKPLIDNTGTWPSSPDFAVVQQALTQARAQLTAQMQSESGVSVTPAQPTQATPPAAPTSQPNSADANKGVSL